MDREDPRGDPQMHVRNYSASCDTRSCPLHSSCSKTGAKVVRPYSQSDSDRVDVLFIAEHGAKSEFLTKNAFAGPEMGLFTEALAGWGEDLSFAYTYLVRGWPIEWSSVPDHFRGEAFLRCRNEWYLNKTRTTGLTTRSDKQTIVSSCRPFLEGELQFLRPKKIVVLGNSVVEALFPRETRAISRLLGAKDVTYSVAGEHIPVRFLPSPVSIMRNPSGKANWQENLRRSITDEVKVFDNSVGPTHLITKLDEALEYLDILSETDTEVSLDYETANIQKAYGNKLACLQFAESAHGGVVIPYSHPESPFDQEELSILRERLQRLFRDPSKIKLWIGHNLKFEANLTASVIGVPLISAPIFDTQAAAFLLDENRTSRSQDFQYGIYTLKQLALEYCNFDGYDKGILAMREEGNLWDLPLPQLAEYGCFEKGNFVTVEGGGIKDISEVVAGDLVLTHKDRYRKVVSAWGKEHQGPVFDIYLEYGAFHIKGVTLNHPFLVETPSGPEWWRAEQLHSGLKVYCTPGLGPWFPAGSPKTLRIRSIVLRFVYTTVYNCEVEEDNSYTINGIKVHNSMDVQVTYRLKERLLEEARRQNYTHQLLHLMEHFITGLSDLFSTIEQNGSPVNLAHIRRLISKQSPLLTRIAEINSSIKQDPAFQRANQQLIGGMLQGRTIKPLGGTPWVFDFAKKGHPQTVFYDVMRLEPTREAGASGLYSVDEEFQEKYAGRAVPDARKVPAVGLFSEWSLMRKMYDSFAATLYSYVDPSGKVEDMKTDCRIRPDYRLYSVVTGRIACRNPALQAIPRPENDAKRAVKDIFQAEKGRAMIEFDYRANEVRWIGIVAKDQKLAENFNKGLAYLQEYKKNPTEENWKLTEMYSDIHKVNSALLFSKPLESVTKMERQRGKALCLGKGTLTSTRRGLVPIEKIRVGDEVWNGKEWTKVLELFRKEAEVFRLEASRGWSLDVSKDHKLLVYDSATLKVDFLEVSSLVKGRHYLVIQTKNLPPLPDEMVRLQFEPDANLEQSVECLECGVRMQSLDLHLRREHKISSKEYKTKHGVRFVQSEAHTRRIGSKNAVHPERYPEVFCEKLAWWLGCLIAEGAIHAKRRWGYLSFSQKKLPDYFDRFVEVTRKLFGHECTIFISKHQVRSASMGAYLRQFVEYLGYSGTCEDKVVPALVFASPRSVQVAFLKGYLSGDGSSTGRVLSAVSKSERLRDDLSALLWSLGYANSKATTHVKGLSYFAVRVTGADFDRAIVELKCDNIDLSRNSKNRHQNDCVPGLLDMLREAKTEHDGKKGGNRRFLIHRNNHVLRELSWHEVGLNLDRYTQLLESTGRAEEAESLRDLEQQRPLLIPFEGLLPKGVQEEVFDLTVDPRHPWFLVQNNLQYDCLSLIYDKGEPALAEELGISIDEVKALLDLFFSQFGSIQQWKTWVKNFAKTHGYVESPHGRRRRFPIFETFRIDGQFDERAVPGEYRSAVAEALRQASNSVIQGLASDSAMQGSILVNQFIRHNKLDWRVQNAVHDSGVFNVPISELKDAMQTIEWLMSYGVKEYFEKNWPSQIEMIILPEVEGKCGLEWGSLREWRGAESELDPLVQWCKEKDLEKWGN